MGWRGTAIARAEEQNPGRPDCPRHFMSKRNNAVWASLCLAAVMALAGCGKGSGTGSGSFAKAPPEIKAAWEKAVAADKANDYVTAVVGYRQILQQRDQLPEAAVSAATEASGKIYQRMVEASGKGDATARQALMTLMPSRERAPVPPR
jgi:hypothetical protein